MISVCMATYNGERYITQQISSIISQLGTEDELIISDDGSTDNTIELIKSFNDKRIKLYSHNKQENIRKKKIRSFYFATKNFENALINAKGDYIFLSDQDDVWRNDKIQKSLEYLKSYDLVISNYAIIDGKENVISSRGLLSCPVSSKSLIYNIVKSKFLGCTMAFNRRALEKVLPFPKNLLAHDLWIGCLNYKRMFYIDDSLHFYRRHGDNVSSASEKSNNSFFYKIYYRIVMLFQVYIRMCRKKHKQ